MLYPTGVQIPFLAQFATSNSGATGLTVTTAVKRINTDGTITSVTTGSATELADGVYFYLLSSASTGTAGYYVCTFTTTGTADLKKIAALEIVGAAWVGNVDATISSRSSHSAADVWAVGTRTLTGFGTLVADVAAAVWAAASRTLTAFGFTVAPTAAAVAAAVWDEATAGHQTAGSTGKQLTDNAATTDPLTNPVPGDYAAGTAGYLLARLAGTPISVTNPVISGSVLELVAGDTYQAERGRALIITLDSTAPDLTDATVKLRFLVGTRRTLTVDVAVTGSQAAYTLTAELTAAQSALLPVGIEVHYAWVATWADSDRDAVTLLSGEVRVLRPS